MHTLGRLQAKDAGQGFHHALLGDDTGLVGIQHGRKILIRIIEEQEHITACIDRGRQHIRTLHPVGHADHMGCVRYDHAVETQFIAKQVGHDLLAQSTGHDGIGSDLRIDLGHVFRHQDMAAHDRIQSSVDQGLIDMAVGGHPLVMAKMVHIIGEVRITVVLSVAGEMLGTGENTFRLVDAVHIGLAHLGDQFVVIAVGTGQNLFTFEIVGDIRDRRKSHITAGSLDLSAGDPAHGLGIFRLAGGTDLDLVSNRSTVHTDTVATLFRVASDKDWDLGILLEGTILIQDHLTGHTVITAAAQMIFLHQFPVIFFRSSGSQLPEQLSDLLLRGHGSNGALYPGDVLILKMIGLSAQIDHNISDPFKQNYVSLCMIEFLSSIADTPLNCNRLSTLTLQILAQLYSFITNSCATDLIYDIMIKNKRRV